MTERSGSLQSSLARHVSSGPNSPEQAHAACKAAWHQHGVFCVSLDGLKSWVHRKQIEQVATELYGARRQK